MAQHDYDIANQNGAAFRTDLNNALDAIVTTNSGSTEPATTFAFQFWADTTANQLKMRNAANDGWIVILETDGEVPAKTFTGDITLNAQSDLRFADSDSSNWVAFQAPATVSSNVTWTLPDADATSSGQALVSDASGTLSWATGGGDISDTAPERTFTNTTEEDTDGGRESKITFKGEQSGGEVSTLAQIRAEHDGTADDEKGQLVFKTNDGSDGSSPTTRLTIDSAGKSIFAANLEVNDLTLGQSPGVASVTNTCFGNLVLQDNTTGGNGGIENTVMGYRAGLELTTGAGNTLIGAYCGKDGVMTGQYNTAMGYQAAEDLSTGENNVCVGRECGAALTTGSSNVFIGDRSGYNQPSGAITGSHNVCLGHFTGASISTGIENVCIGKSAGENITTGSSNVCLGEGTGAGLTTTGNNTLLGHGAGSTGSPSGNVTGVHQICLGNNSVTDLFCADTSISSSDQRDKADITDFAHGLDWITQMRPVIYKWDKRSWYVDFDANPDTDLRDVTPDGTHKKDRINIGLLAQEVQSIEQADGFASDRNTELLSRTTEDGQQIGLKYERIVPVLINAVKELKTANDALTARVAALEAA